jgi:hypothetical protein
MVFKKEKSVKEFTVFLITLLYAYLINYFSGNIGVLPIDSFSFLDTGNIILQGNVPIRDFWIFTGLIIDYMQAIFTLFLGKNWNSYLAHSSFMNIIGTAGLFFFLKELNLKFFYIIFYCICFATLCYPLSGTPFAYLHAYIFSLLAIFNLLIAIKKQNNTLWFIFPFICFFAFLSMQTPTIYILFILFLIITYNFFQKKNYRNLSFFLIGSFSSSILFLLFLIFNKISIIDFIYQYVLFPISIGEERISSGSAAYIGLKEQLNFKRIFGEFKFIHIFLTPLIYISFKNLRKNEINLNILNLTVILCCFAFLFNQLITANQIYIFSLIPILAAILQLNLDQINLNPKYFFLLIFLVLFATIKFHYRFNIDRKFHELENINKKNAINANEINKNFNNLKWISKHDNPKEEIRVIKKAIEIFNEDKRKKILITNYHFMSLVLKQNFNILNRWYLWTNDTHPTENHKYFNYYQAFASNQFKKNKIEVIYLFGKKNEISLKNIQNYFVNICFTNDILIPSKLSKHEIKKCN